MINKFCRISLYILTSLFINVSCSNLKSNPVEEVSEINIWTVDMSSRLDKYKIYVTKKFEENNPKTKINWSNFSSYNIVSKLYASWQENNLPDIVSFDAQTLVNGINDELIVDLYKFDKEFLNRFFEGILKTSEKNNRLLGIPWYTDIKVLFINKFIMDKANISKDNYPKTESEFLELFGTIKNNSEKFGSVIEPESMKNLIFNGLDVINEDGNVYINKSSVINYFKYNQSKFKNKEVPKQFSNFDDKIYLYSNNEIAMIKSNFQFINSIKKISKEVYENTVIFPIPTGKDGIRYTDTTYLSIINNGKDESLSMEFIKFLLDDENQMELLNSFNVLPVTKKFLEFGSIDESIDSKLIEAKKVAFDSLDKAKDFIYNIKNYTPISNIIEKYSRSIYLDDIEVESVINDIQQEINQFNN